jgi:hypothetical protein
MKKILYQLIPSKQDLFSIQSVLLSIFVLFNFDYDFGLLFMVIVFLYAIGMDLLYRICK